MVARDLLFELRTEELPPRTLSALSFALTEGIAKGINAAGIAHGGVHGFATPRRLAVRVEKLDVFPDSASAGVEIERRQGN